MFIWLCFRLGLLILYYIMVILRSTTGPYGRPRIEVAYGEILFSLYRGCMGGDSLERVVGVSTCCRPCWTYSGQHQCGLNVYYFLGFYTIKTNMYYVFKSIHIYSIYIKTLVVSDLILARWGSENVFDRPLVLENKINTIDDFSWVLKTIMIYHFIMIFVKFNLLVFSIMKYFVICFYSLFDSFPHWAYDVLMFSFVLYLTG